MHYSLYSIYSPLSLVCQDLERISRADGVYTTGCSFQCLSMLLIILPVLIVFIILVVQSIANYYYITAPFKKTCVKRHPKVCRVIDANGYCPLGRHCLQFHKTNIRKEYTDMKGYVSEQLPQLKVSVIVVKLLKFVAMKLDDLEATWQIRVED